MKVVEPRKRLAMNDKHSTCEPTDRKKEKNRWIER